MAAAHVEHGRCAAQSRCKSGGKGKETQGSRQQNAHDRLQKKFEVPDAPAMEQAYIAWNMRSVRALPQAGWKSPELPLPTILGTEAEVGRASRWTTLRSLRALRWYAASRDLY